MTQMRNLDYQDRLPEMVVDALQELLGTFVSPNFEVTLANSTTLQIVASTGNDQVTAAVEGRWRYIIETITAAHPGGSAGVYDVWITASDNDVAPSGLPPGQPPEVDSTVYAFALAIKASGSPPTTALKRKVATCAWSGSAITGITTSFSIPYGLTDANIAAAAAIAYSKLALGNSIVNADIAVAAAIARSKLDFGSGLVNADIAAAAAIAYSKLALGNSIVNADIAVAAAIARSKLDFGSGLVNADIATTAAIAASKLYGAGSDYTPTVTGWANPSRICRYIQLAAKLFLINFHIDGTSNATTATMTLPPAAGNLKSGGSNLIYVPIAAVDNNTNIGSAFVMAPLDGSNILKFYPQILCDTWTASGAKAVAGQIIVEVA